jgi:ribokinase
LKRIRAAACEIGWETAAVRVAVVGHVEWVEFARVPRMPAAGEIVHAEETWEEAAGGGAVVAVQLANLGAETTFVTALGEDDLGRRSEEQLTAQGLRLDVQWRREPTRRASTLVDSNGERTIVVLGDKLAPRGPIEGLEDLDLVFFVSGDVAAARSARAARTLVATARELATLRLAAVRLDALVGSAEDVGERYEPGDIEPPPALVVRTAGADGGAVEGGGAYEAAPLPGPISDAYGCGDCFSAGFAFSLANGSTPAASAALGARCGAAVLTGRGPYERQLRLPG